MKLREIPWQQMVMGYQATSWKVKLENCKNIMSQNNLNIFYSSNMNLEYWW